MTMLTLQKLNENLIETIRELDWWDDTVYVELTALFEVYAQEKEKLAK